MDTPVIHNIETHLNQLRVFAEQYFPEEALTKVVQIAVVVLIVGAGISVLGAKLARFGITCGFVGLGGYVGHLFAGQSDIPNPLGVVAGAAMIGVVGFLTFRFWAGALAAAVCSTLAFGVFSYTNLLPQVAQFDPVLSVSAELDTASLTLPTSWPAEMLLPRESAQQWAQEFWAHVSERNADIPRTASAIILGAGVIGLFLGILAVRPMLILCTSVLGTMLVTSGLATIGSDIAPDLYQSGIDHPRVIGMAMASVLVTSLVLQTMLTSPPPAEPAESI